MHSLAFLQQRSVSTGFLRLVFGRPSGTTFQQAVWEQLLAIPHGATSSYGQLAEATGRPGASRAVGMANGSNRIAIVIPCHRVIHKNGGLSGYAGGVSRKRALLDLESNSPSANATLFPD